MAVKNNTLKTTKEIKEAIKKEGVRNDYLQIIILGHVATEGNSLGIEPGELLYCVSVSNFDIGFDYEVFESTSLAKVEHRAEQLYNSLSGYNRNKTILGEFDGTYYE